MILRTLLLLGIILFIIPLQHAQAVKPLTVQELALHCQALPDRANSVDGQYCIRYIQGFIDGAIATDVRVLLNVEADHNHKETFTERALRTRTAHDRAAAYAEFCLGEPVPLGEVVEKVVSDLNQRKYAEEGIAAGIAVYASLRKNYPCK
ncbi:MAG: hypothetical protein IMF09_03490 [Proteobacteria bacterium]|nr:hypothetical protein [Pseudomonadota bacterium]